MVNHDKILERLFEIFDESGLNQREIADLIGVRPQVISEWKPGKTKTFLKYIDVISEKLHVSSDYIYCKTNEKYPPMQQSRRASILTQLSDLSTNDLAQVLEYVEFLHWRESQKHQ